MNAALDNIKAQIAKHYQRISDRDAYVTAEMVRNAYQGIGTEYETLLRAFDKENGAFAKGWERPFQADVPEVSHRKEVCGGLHQGTVQAQRHFHERADGGLYPRLLPVSP